MIELREGIVYIPNESMPFTGLLQKFYENGQKELEKNYKDGKQDGLVTLWDKNGQKQSEANYKNDKSDGVYTIWNENGQKTAELNYKDGKQDGLMIFWHENGKKQSEVNYKDGKADGLSISWHENGQKFIEINYKDGEMVAPEKSSAEENWRTQCSSIASLAEKAMDARQAGVSMVKLMEAANTSKLIENMIIAAYEIDRYSSVEVQQSVIGDFHDKAYLNCLKTLKP